MSRMASGLSLALVVLIAGAGSAAGQTSPAQPNDVRKLLNQTQSKPGTPQAQPKAAAPAAGPAAKQAAAQAQPAAKKPATTSAPSAAKPAVQGTAKTATAAAPKAAAQGTAKPVPGGTAKPAAPAAAKGAQGAGASPATPVAEHIARRDPFDALVGKEKAAAGPQVQLPAGKAGLVVATLNVDGVVHGPNGMIAVVSNPQMRVYFLREGDQLYDGAVEHITMEGIAFHQTGRDAFGKPVEREVTKRLYPTPGELQ
jgi:hypothetical protein